jgi:hypothetical protein
MFTTFIKRYGALAVILKRFICLLIIALNTLASVACAVQMSFLGDINLPAGTQYDGTEFGGISGLAYREEIGAFLAISDDKGDIQSPRMYSIKLTLGTPLGLDIVQVTTLMDQGRGPFPLLALDPEGIAASPGGRVFVSSEGNLRSGTPRVNPRIFELRPNGEWVADLQIPEKYIPNHSEPQSKGVFNNGAFETLTLTPSEDFLFTALEEPLVQDDTPASVVKGAKGRILRFARNGETYSAGQEFVYPIEMNPIPQGQQVARDLYNGVSDMLALDQNHLIAMERGTVQVGAEAFMTSVRLYLVTITDTATDVSGMDSLRDQSYIPVEKSLLLDLNSILDRLTPGWQNLDNLEGISFGPSLPNGNRTVILISDDNFNAVQRTQALVFELSN